MYFFRRPQVSTMHLKLILALSLVTVTLALPEPGLLRGLTRTSKESYYLSSFGIFYKGVSKSLQQPFSILQGLSQTKTRASLDACLDVIISAGTASAGILENKYSGVYDLYTSLLLGLSRGLLCTNAWTNEYRSKICRSTYGKKLGYSKYTGDYDQFSSVADYYSLSDIKSQLQVIVRKRSGKDINKLKGTEEVIFSSMLELLKLKDRNRTYLRRNGLRVLYQYVTTIVAALANSHKRGLGHKIATEMESYCSDTFQRYGYDISTVYSSYIKVRLDVTTRESFYNALIVENDDDDTTVDGASNTDDNSNTNDDNNNNDTTNTEDDSKTSKKDTSDDSKTRYKKNYKKVKTSDDDESNNDDDSGTNDDNNDNTATNTKDEKNTYKEVKSDASKTRDKRNKKETSSDFDYEETDRETRSNTRSETDKRIDTSRTVDTVKKSKKPQKCTCVDDD